MRVLLLAAVVSLAGAGDLEAHAAAWARGGDAARCVDGGARCAYR